MSMRRDFSGARAGVLAGGIGVALLAGWIGLSRARDASSQPVAGSRRVIDDFSATGEKDSPAVRWQFGAEGVARGASAGKVQVEEHEGRMCLHLTGAVSSNNKADFIQARRSLVARGQPLDAHAYDGIQLTVKGNGRIYAISLRTLDARSPKQYYRAEFPTHGQWQEIKLPFGSFVPVAITAPLNVAALMSVAVVAGIRESNADICIGEIALYREQNMNRNLTPEEERVIVRKGTERPFSGQYNKHFEKGVYTCKRCGAELFESSSKFRSDCGWPSFDDQIPGRVKWQPDADGRRTEVICANCGAHLGHVFLGEHLTEKNTRYCVNSISMDFIPAEQRVPFGVPRSRGSDQSFPPEGGTPNEERAIFASGCFWGTEYYMQRAPGVVSTTVGFTGGHVDHPTYKQVSTGRTGHAESVEVVYDPAKTSYEQLAKLFFETHDFTQWNRQGPDIGPQYRSAVFYLNDEQKQIAERLVQQLRQMGYDVKTQITRAGQFWPAEDYHQHYYDKTGKTPYCHIYRPIFQSQPSGATSP
jgi:peptide methionine sulfoxide reductase msrA/msrB